LDKKTWTKRRIVGIALILPAIAVNYAAVILLQQAFNLQHFYILSAVLIGDVIGMTLNLFLTDWNYRMIHKYGGRDEKLFRHEVCPKCGASLDEKV